MVCIHPATTCCTGSLCRVLQPVQCTRPQPTVLCSYSVPMSLGHMVFIVLQAHQRWVLQRYLYAVPTATHQHKDRCPQQTGGCDPRDGVVVITRSASTCRQMQQKPLMMLVCSHGWCWYVVIEGAGMYVQASSIPAGTTVSYKYHSSTHK